MKKLLSLILGITLLTSMFVFTIPASAFVNAVEPTTMLNGLPTVTEGVKDQTFSEGGFTATVDNNTSGNTVTTVSGALKVTTAGTESAIIDFSQSTSYEDLQNADYDFIEYEYSVSYEGAPKALDIRVFNRYNRAQIAPAQYGYTLVTSWNASAYYIDGPSRGMDLTGERVDKILVRIDIKKGILNAYINDEPSIYMMNIPLSLENGLGTVRLTWTGNNSSIIINNFEVRTANREYSRNKVLMSGLDNFLTGAIVNKVDTYTYPELTSANAPTMTDGVDGAKVFSNFKQDQRFYLRNYTGLTAGTTVPEGGKIYYQYTMSFSAPPKAFTVNMQTASGTSTALPTLYASGKWQAGIYTYEYPAFASNTPYNIGLLYDLKTGYSQVYVNGVPSNTCFTTYSAEFKNLYYTVSFNNQSTDTVTISDLLVMRIEPGTYNLETGNYEADDDAKLNGINGVPNCFRWTENGIIFQALTDAAGGSIEMTKIDNNYIKVTNAVPKDPESASLPYTRMIFWHDVNKTKYESGIVAYKWDFAIEGEEGAEQEVNIESRNGGGTNTMSILAEKILPGEHEIEFIYNPATYQYRCYIDGKAGEAGVLPSEKLTNGNLPDLFIQWKSKVKENAFILKDVKFSHIDDFAEVPLSFGDVTISEENVASFPVTAPKYSLVNPAEMRFIISAYLGNRLTAVNCETKPIYSGENTVTLSLDDLKSGTVVKAFLWNDLTPIAAATK